MNRSGISPFWARRGHNSKSTASSAILRQRLKTFKNLMRGAYAVFSTHSGARGLNEIKVLSIDIFDTLLLRHPGYDEEVRAMIISKAVSLAQQNGVSVQFQEAHLLLNSIESRMKRQLRMRGLDEELWRGDALREMLSQLLTRFATREEVELLLSSEISYLYQRTVINPEINEILERAQADNIRVIAVSDMYLNSKELQSLLSMHEIGGLSEVYSSCDTGQGKLSGQLFKHVLRCENIAPSAILHIGNSLSRDVLSAAAHGMNVRLIMPPRIRKSPPFDELRSQAYAFGRDTLGPPLATFAHLLLLNAKRRDIKHLAFLARDGYVLMKITETLILSATVEDPPRLSYAYLSRRALALANSDHVDENIVDEILSMPVSGGKVARILAAYDIPPNIVAPHLHRLGIDPEHGSTEDLQILLEDPEFSDLFTRESYKRRRLIIRYLEQENISSETTAFVDVGWRGSIASYLATFLGESQTPINLLLGFWHDKIMGPPKHADRKIGLLSDYRRGCSIYEVAAWQVSSLLEAVCRGPHGSVLGFSEDSEGRVVPVMAGNSESRRVEMISETIRSNIERGILDYAANYGCAENFFLLDEEKARRHAQMSLLRLGFFPRGSEITIAEHLSHTEASAEDWSAPLIPRMVYSPIRDPRRWLMGLSSPWRAGYVAKTGGYSLALVFLLLEATLLKLPSGWKTRLRRIALRTARGH